MHFLVLSGRTPSAFAGWAEFRETISECADELARTVRSRSVQTNEVRRSWTLVPCFLELARRTGVDSVDLVELGSSAGLNLVWDRYRYEYERGCWGQPDASLVLRGEERSPVPDHLLARSLAVGRRLGIDLEPIDVTTEEGALTLKSSVWAGQPERLATLDHAITVLRRDPPEIVRGDFAEVLPDVLERRRTDVLTVVFSTATISYLTADARVRVRSTLTQAGAGGSLAWLSTSRPEEGTHDHWGLWLELFPAPRELVARADFHGAWLDWLL